jgi:hypothetical protein
MTRWSRRLLQVLLALALLWQTAIVPTAALAGCCDGEQPCCLALRASAGCLSCVPVLADTLVALALSPVGAKAAPISLDPQVQPNGLVHDIWRPPMTRA